MMISEDSILNNVTKIQDDNPPPASRVYILTVPVTLGFWPAPLVCGVVTAAEPHELHPRWFTAFTWFSPLQVVTLQCLVRLPTLSHRKFEAQARHDCK